MLVSPTPAVMYRMPSALPHLADSMYLSASSCLLLSSPCSQVYSGKVFKGFYDLELAIPFTLDAAGMQQVRAATVGVARRCAAHPRPPPAPQIADMIKVTDDQLIEAHHARRGVPVYLLHLRFTGGSDATASNINHALGAARFPGVAREKIAYCHIECEGCECSGGAGART